MTRTFLAATAASLAISSATLAQTASGAEVEIDPDAYVGLWYEIARTPTPFQQDCAGGVTAIYELSDPETLRVVNRCDLADGGVNAVEGAAEPADGDFGRLAVSFDGAPDGDADYIVEAVGPEEDGRYPWAAVTAGEGTFGWILARSPDLDSDARQEAEAALEGAGIDPAQLRDTEQPPSTYDPNEE